MERTASGQFVKGHSGGPGRPRKPIEEKYLRKLSTAVTLRDWADIIERAIYDAKRGDTAARKWLSDYLMGTPMQRIEQSTHVTGDIIIDWSEITQAGGENTD